MKKVVWFNYCTLIHVTSIQRSSRKMNKVLTVAPPDCLVEPHPIYEAFAEALIFACALRTSKRACKNLSVFNAGDTGEHSKAVCSCSNLKHIAPVGDDSKITAYLLL